MNNLISKFHNRSLRSKMVILICSLVFVLLVMNGLIINKLVNDGFEENIEELNTLSVTQMSINLNRTLEDIVKDMVGIRDSLISQRLQYNEPDSLAYLMQRIEYQNLFYQMLANNNNYGFINSMIVLDKYQNQYVYSVNKEQKVKNEDLFTKIVEEYLTTTGDCWSGLLISDYYFEDGDEEIISIFMPVLYYSKIEAILIVNISVESIEEYMYEMSENQTPLILYLNEKESISVNADNAEIVEEIASETLTINEWELSICENSNSMNERLNTIIQTILLIVVTTIVILLISVSFIIYMITKPINKMTLVMELNRHNKELNHRFYPKYQDEVGVLANSYNHLMDEIQQLMKDIKKEQIEKNGIYLQLLQMQINPHFLYNTLDSIRFLVEMKDDQAGRMLTVVGKFYKLSLSGIYDTVQIEEEVEQLRCYIEILKMRYSSRYDFEIQINDEILKNEIVKFTLQPLVENAVYHGVKQKRGEGKVIIAGKYYNDMIEIIIWDNGKGMSTQKLQEVREKLSKLNKIDMSKNIGIANVHKRLQMQYGEDYGLTINSEANEYTEVTVQIPVKQKI